SFRLYLNEIARFKLLTPQEEIDLFKRIENGRVLTQLSEWHMEETGTPPSPEELTYLLLGEMAQGLEMLRASRAIRCLPPPGGFAEAIHFPRLRDGTGHGRDP